MNYDFSFFELFVRLLSLFHPFIQSIHSQRKNKYPSKSLLFASDLQCILIIPSQVTPVKSDSLFFLATGIVFVFVVMKTRQVKKRLLVKNFRCRETGEVKVARKKE